MPRPYVISKVVNIEIDPLNRINMCLRGGSRTQKSKALNLGGGSLELYRKWPQNFSEELVICIKKMVIVVYIQEMYMNKSVSKKRIFSEELVICIKKMVIVISTFGKCI